MSSIFPGTSSTTTKLSSDLVSENFECKIIVCKRKYFNYISKWKPLSIVVIITIIIITIIIIIIIVIILLITLLFLHKAMIPILINEYPKDGLLYLFKIIIFAIKHCFWSPAGLIEFPPDLLCRSSSYAKLFNYSNHLSILRINEIPSGLLMTNASSVKTLF